ncbi:MAG: hypothetical protein DVB26_01405 [Verrucomicrobia bacterium]|nr:MAG: hypothetical protein DVB26_01405 [Verrucomicrobiota bacterium]
MHHKFPLFFASILATGFASAADGLYHVGTEAQNSAPLKWSTGMSLTYDDNVNPGSASKASAVSLNPYAGLSFLSLTPQTTWDVFARLGCLYYIDKPATTANDPGVDSIYAQVRTTANLTHRIDERLRFSSRNSLSYELEPDYAYGVASGRLSGAYLFWGTDNSLGYRWTERVATYSGLNLTALEYGGSANQNQNRFTWEAYNQFRYQLTPERSVLTFDYRYGQTTAAGLASDSTNQYLLGGLEYRFSPTAILVTKAGMQIRQLVVGTNTNDPYAEMALDSRINQDFTLRSFLRYSIESYDTVQQVAGSMYDFNKRQTLRIGISGDYAISQNLTFNSGLDYIPSKFNDGTLVMGGGAPTAGGLTSDVFNASVGLSLKLMDRFYGSVSYNYTDSTSQVSSPYTRSRISLGVSYQF